MVNIGSKYSVNDIFFNEMPRIKKEISEIEKETAVPEGLNKDEYLARVWIYRAIKNAGGYAIFPHPYWNIGFNHTSTPMSKAIIKNGLCDAFEALGGGDPVLNNKQIVLYNELRSEGCDTPRVYGKLRLVLYAHFLLENYYPVHNELCSVSGIFIDRYLNGDNCEKELIEKAEDTVSKYEKEFFGI